MKTLLLYLFLFFLIPLEAYALPQDNLCPREMIIAIECVQNKNDFQLLKHLGRYSQPKMEVHDNHLICSYGVTDWISKYRYTDAVGEKILTVSSLRELSTIAKLIRQKGFDVGPLDEIQPFTMVTYKQDADQFTRDQMYLYSGLESTFEKDNFTVSAENNNNITTAVINDRFLKSQNAAADTFVTGSNCSIMIR